MTARHLSPPSWAAELESFSRQHEGWLVSVITRASDGRVAVDADDLPLIGISRASPENSDIAITVGNLRDHFTHEVHDATALRIDLTADRAERALVIGAKDGSTTTVEFRSAVRPEEVDGFPIRERR